MIRTRTAFTSFVLALVLVPNPLTAQARRPITDTDLFKFVWAADPQISPNGSQVAFVRVTADPDKDRYDTQIYLVPSDGSAAPRPLTSGRGDRAPRWSPDGRRLAFVRTPEPVDGKSKPAQIYVMSMDGGEARALTDAPKGASSPVWSPDGKTIAFLSVPDTAKTDSAKKSTDTTRKHVSDVRVITRAQYRWNGAGYTDVTAHSHIWTVASAFPTAGGLPTAKQITSGTFDESQPVWSPDGSRLYFTSDRHLEPYYEITGEELYSVPSAGGTTTKVAALDGSIDYIAISPDGKRIAFTGNENAKPVRFFDQGDIYVMDATPGAKPVNLSANYDYDVRAGLSGDQHPPRAGNGGGIIWSRDGQSLIVVTAENGRANLRRFPVNGGASTAVTSGDQEVVSYTADNSGSKIVALISTPVNIGDLFLVDASRLSPPAARQITRVNESLFSTLDIPSPEEINYNSFDGKRIQGWILKPPRFDGSKKYPLILEIHGGPNAAYGYTFTHEFDWMATKGYVVLYVNPRGSTTYGQDFANIIQHNYPGDDYKDIMVGVDEVLKRGYVDSTRMGVTGGSGGGVLTNWTVGHTHRFAAAVSQRSIADWTGFWYAADFTLFHPTWFSGPPWENQKQFEDLSPITYVTNITTPIMFVEGEADMRTPPAMGGEQMFRALKYLHKPTVMVRFPDETHELSRSGKPWHRVERLRHILGWFDKYLQGQKEPQYDVQ
ncbi:MAG TPA: S9 family peptidase [Gemmatimonadaceae bacterium]|nr:S9 family peptidase [Gemmatimonadaceae bacterium]